MPTAKQINNRQALPSPTRRNWVWFSIQMLLRFFYIVWLRYRARGHEKLPPSTGALLLLNHQSFLDPLLVGLPLQRPVSYVARNSLFPVPVVGWILRHTYVMPLNLDQPGAAVIRESIRRMQHGFLVGIFPEGSRTEDGRMGELKPGFITLLRRARVPVYPVGIAGAFEAFPRGNVMVRPENVRVVFGDPLDPETLRRLSQRGREDELLTLVRQKISACAEKAAAWRQSTR